MIYLSGMKTKSGFTLLEVVVAITIFAIAFTILIKIHSKHIADFHRQIEKLEAIKYFKIYNYKIPNEIISDKFQITQQTTVIDYGIKQITYSILNKEKEKILEIKTYEK